MATLLACLAPSGLAAQEAVAGARPDDGAGVRYPLDLLRTDCLGRACGPFRLLDLELEAGRLEGGTAGFRLQVGDGMILGFREAGDDREASLVGSRLAVRYHEADLGGRRIDAELRGPRLRFGAGAEQRPDEEGGGWTADARLGYRTGRDLEVTLAVERDLEDEIPLVLEPRTRTGGRLGVIWQRGASLDLHAGVGYARLRDGTGERVERWSADLGAVWLAEPFQLEATARLDDTRGRFRRPDVTADVRLAYRPLAHLLVQGGLGETVELGVSERSRRYAAGVAFHGRRYQFPRGGRLGPAALAASTVAWRTGFGEARSYEVAGLRAFRERASLAGNPELLGAAHDLYRAQVEDRDLPQIAVAWEAEHRRDVETRIHTVAALVGVPWPLAPPWATGQHRTRFLELTFGYAEAQYGPRLREIARSVGLRVRLNRELDARLAWSQSLRTPLDLVLDRGESSRVIAGLAYRFGV